MSRKDALRLPLRSRRRIFGPGISRSMLSSLDVPPPDRPIFEPHPMEERRLMRISECPLPGLYKRLFSQASGSFWFDLRLNAQNSDAQFSPGSRECACRMRHPFFHRSGSEVSFSWPIESRNLLLDMVSPTRCLAEAGPLLRRPDFPRRFCGTHPLGPGSVIVSAPFFTHSLGRRANIIN